MSGYANRYVPLKFPQLSEAGDEVYVVIRNPRILPPNELRPKGDAFKGNAEDIDEDAAMAAMHEMFARLIVGWHAYSGAGNPAEQDQPVTLSAEGEMVLPDQELLTWPPTAEKVATLPTEIIGAITEAIQEATNPR